MVKKLHNKSKIKLSKIYDMYFCLKCWKFLENQVKCCNDLELFKKKSWFIMKIHREIFYCGKTFDPLLYIILLQTNNRVQDVQMHCLKHDYMLIDCYMLYSKLSPISNGIPFFCLFTTFTECYILLSLFTI